MSDSSELSENKIVQFDLSKNEEIFNDEQRNSLINKFPKELHGILYEINNPLNEKEVIMKLFLDKNIKIISIPYVDEYDDPEYKHHFNCKDLAINIKYSESNISKWNSRFKLNLKSYNELIKEYNDRARTICTSTKHDDNDLINENNGCAPTICRSTKFDDNEQEIKNNGDIIYIGNFEKIDEKAYFIEMKDIKELMMHIKTDESMLYRKWIIEYSEISYKLIKWIMKIKQKYENENLINKIKQIEEDKQKEINNIKGKMKIRIQQSVDFFPSPIRVKGKIYITQDKYTTNKIKNFKIGNTTLDIKTRENQLQTSNPDIQIVHSVEVLDVNLIEDLIHEYLNNLNYNKEFL